MTSKEKVTRAKNFICHGNKIEVQKAWKIEKDMNKIHGIRGLPLGRRWLELRFYTMTKQKQNDEMKFVQKNKMWNFVIFLFFRLEKLGKLELMIFYLFEKNE